MRWILTAACLGVPISSAYAVSDSFTLKAQMTLTCFMTGDVTEVDLGGDLDGADNDAVVNQGAEGVNNYKIAAWGDSYCNGAHEIRVTSANNGMTAALAVPGGSDDFDTAINYTATVRGWGAATPSITTDNAGAGGFGNTGDTVTFNEESVASAFRNDAQATTTGNATDALELLITLEEGSNPLMLSDAYSDIVTVLIQADD